MNCGKKEQPLELKLTDLVQMHEDLLEQGFIYDSKSKSYLQINQQKFQEIIDRIVLLEKRIDTLESRKYRDFKVIKFDSKRYSKNYRLNREVVDLIEMVKRDYSHLNVTDVINTVLYSELTKLKK